MKSWSDLPPPRFRALTIPEGLYLEIKSLFEEEREQLAKKGIRSISAWVTTVLYEAVREHRLKRGLASAEKATNLEGLKLYFGNIGGSLLGRENYLARFYSGEQRLFIKKLINE